jgi:hypothetical protein
LEDSDSDGANDGVEVSTSNDPNCPRGKECRQPKIGATTPTTSGAASGSQTTSGSTATAPPDAYQAIVETFGDPATLTPESIATKIAAMSSAELRAFLTEMGIPEAALQKADDATLRQLLSETLGEISGTN